MSMALMVKAMKIRVGNPLRKLVLIKLADNASDQGECWPSYQHIADQCEISKRSVMNHIAALCESGLVKKVTRKGEKGNSSNIYLLHLDGAGDSLGGSANNSLSGAANSPGSAGVAPGGNAGDSPRTSHSFEPVKEPVNEPIAVGASADESVRVRSNRPEYSPEFEQAWLAYPKRAGGNSKSAAFKAWKARLNEGVNPETMLEGVKRYAGWVSAMGNRIRDLDNYNKALFDALTHAGVWEDDRQVKRMLVEWGPVIPKGKVEITISKYEKPAGAAA
ncbi:RusA family crossover junction endodeoxyribonuclease [Escherichia coli]|nr:helix-turn-helix domain-containing protein [Escherichia coli]MDM4897454.1 RusA family crossover junction endodeoxyribonuclease [Escherichia coli]WHF82257.1 RusA family crossover junction endodeoxyribonuclease [Escherichia coli]WHH74340.1 RusA family crossover junction endodeoxyribonuclease [Escherichia coli]WHH76788.1 RusA family crossover junction endodeoxyribonuclease [Escherichia coli]